MKNSRSITSVFVKTNANTFCPTEETINAGMDAKNQLGHIGLIQNLSLDDLEIGAYQKNLDINRVRKIVSKFDINRMRPIDVSFRDGHYHCVCYSD